MGGDPRNVVMGCESHKGESWLLGMAAGAINQANPDGPRIGGTRAEVITAIGENQAIVPCCSAQKTS